MTPRHPRGGRPFAYIVRRQIFLLASMINQIQACLPATMVAETATIVASWRP